MYGRGRIAFAVNVSFTLALVSSAAVRADLIPIGPFTGQLSESWESFPTSEGEDVFLPDPTTIMNGAATVSNPRMVIFEAAGWGFGLGSSGYAQPSDGLKGMGLSGVSQTATITFEQPVTHFGAYWGARTDIYVGYPALIEFSFLDESGQLLGADVVTYMRPYDGILEWHGWRSTLPFTTVTYSEDFVAVDGLQAIPLPEPTAIALASSLCVALCLLRPARR